MARFGLRRAARPTAGPPVTHSIVNAAVIEDRLRRFQRRRVDDREQVVDADGVVDRLLNSCVPLQAMRAPLGCGLQTNALPDASMLMALHASVGSECVTGVMAPMTPNGAIFLQADAVLAAEGFGLQELDAGDALGDDLQLLDLVRQPADLRLFQFLAAERFGLLRADLADALHGLAAVFQPATLELALRFGRG